jgi:hypothetical protein
MILLEGMTESQLSFKYLERNRKKLQVVLEKIQLLWSRLAGSMSEYQRI